MAPLQIGAACKVVQQQALKRAHIAGAAQQRRRERERRRETRAFVRTAPTTG